MQRHRQTLHFDTDRKAMQVTGCGGAVIAVFPLDERAVARFASQPSGAADRASAEE
jgi:hypothetical protein